MPQANDGSGACFPLHFDSDETVDSRRLTALFYLNPDWRARSALQLPRAAPASCSGAASAHCPNGTARACARRKRGDGGELVLYPSLTRKVLIEPVLDRLVLFSGARVPPPCRAGVAQIHRSSA